MARWKKTDVETKAKVISSKIWNTDKTLEEIWEENNLSKSTVADILYKDLPEYLKENPDVATQYYNKINWIWITRISLDDSLDVDKEILSEYLSFIWWYKEAKEYIEWFMLQSIWKSYIRRKSVNYNTKYAVLERAWFKCQACWVKPNKDNNVELEIDHIIPHSMGWLSVKNNYQVLCKQCNVSKRNNFIYNHNENEG